MILAYLVVVEEDVFDVCFFWKTFESRPPTMTYLVFVEEDVFDVLVLLENV